MGAIENFGLYMVFGMTAVFFFTLTDAALTGLVGDRLSKGSEKPSATGV